MAAALVEHAGRRVPRGRVVVVVLHLQGRGAVRAQARPPATQLPSAPGERPGDEELCRAGPWPRCPRSSAVHLLVRGEGDGLASPALSTPAERNRGAARDALCVVTEQWECGVSRDPRRVLLSQPD